MENLLYQLKQKYNICISKHEWGEALSVLQQMITIELNPLFYCKKGGIFFKLKEYKKSISAFEKALKISPSCETAMKCLDKLRRNKDIAGYGDLVFVAEPVSPLYDDLQRSNPLISRESPLDSAIVTKIETSLEVMTPAPISDTVDTVADISGQSDLLKNVSKDIHDFSSISSENFGRYTIIEKIGSGGMGHVYKVEDTELKRILALKVVNIGLETEEGKQRFLREAQATAKLIHPNIICVHDIGEEKGRHFFTMDHIEGMLFKDYCRSPKNTIRRTLYAFLEICKGISFAHENGVIHRDIKPSNIMLTKKNVPKIMDFGLAKLAHADQELSRTGQQMGTPAYMSPEQADGKQIDNRADIYSLGATLYEALTGRPPFQGDNHFNIIYQLHYKDPVSLRLLNPDISPELEAICLKCLEKQPKNRYASAEDLALDVQNFLEHRPIMAKPATSFTKLVKLARRNRKIFATIAVILLTLICGGSFSLMQWQKAEQEKFRMVEKSTAILISRAKENLLKDDWREAGVLGGEALEIAKPYTSFSSIQKLQTQAYDIVRAALFGMGLRWEKYISIEQDNTTALCHSQSEMDRYRRATDIVKFHPDGKRIAIGCKDGTIKIVDAWDGKIILMIEDNVNSAITSLAFHSNGKVLASGNWHGVISAWEVNTGKKIGFIQQHQGVVSSLKFTRHPKKNLLFSTSWDKTIKVWNIKQEKTIHTFSQETAISSMALRRDDHQVAYVADTEIRLWNTGKKQPQDFVDTQYVPNTAISYNSDGNMLAVSSWENKIQLYDAIDKELKTELIGHSAGVTTLKFHPEYNMLVSAAENGEIIIWDSKTYQPLRKFSADGDYIQSIDIHPNTNQIISYSSKGFLRNWSINSKELSSGTKEQVAFITSIDVSPDGKKLASCDKEGYIYVWDYHNKKLLHQWRGHEKKIINVEYSPDGNTLISCGYDAKIKLWNTDTYELIDSLEGHNNIVVSAKFSTDGNKIASASRDATAKIWIKKQGKFVAQDLSGLQSDFPYFDVAFSPDGKMLAVVSKSITIFDAKTLKKIITLKGVKNWFSRLSFSPDSKILASSSGDSTVRLWDVDQIKKKLPTKPLHVFKYSSWVWRIAFHRDGKLMACAFADGTIRILDIHNRIQVEKLILTEKQNMFALEFHPQDQVLISGAMDKKIKYWDFSPKWSNNKKPIWIESSPKQPEISPTFNFREDISGSLIQQLMVTQPQKICRKLFGLQVTDNFSIISYPVEKRTTKTDTIRYNHLQQLSTHYENKNYTQAIDCALLLIELKQDTSIISQQFPKIQKQVAAAQLQKAKRLGDYQQAITLCTFAINLDPKAEYYLQRSIFHEKCDNEQQKNEDFKKAIEINPELKVSIK